MKWRWCHGVAFIFYLHATCRAGRQGELAKGGIGPQKRLQDKNRSLRFEYLAAYCNERYLSTPVD